MAKPERDRVYPGRVVTNVRLLTLLRVDCVRGATRKANGAFSPSILCFAGAFWRRWRGICDLKPPRVESLAESIQIWKQTLLIEP
jgi:hypothetical protein